MFGVLGDSAFGTDIEGGRNRETGETNITSQVTEKSKQKYFVTKSFKLVTQKKKKKKKN